MPIGLAVLFKITFVSAGCDNGFVAHGDHHHGLFVVRIFHGNLPCAAVRLAADGLHVAAEIQKCGGDALFAQKFRCLLTGIALCNAAEVDFHACRQDHFSGDFIVLHIRVIDQRQKGGELLLARHLVAAGRKAPCAHNGVNGNI